MNWNTEVLARLLRENETWLMRQPGVVGAGLGSDPEGQPCLEIVTDSLLHVVRRAIQKRLGGAPLQFTEKGRVDGASGRLGLPGATVSGFWLACGGDRGRLPEDGAPPP